MSISSIKTYTFLPGLLLSILLLSACGGNEGVSVASEKEDRTYARGKRLYREECYHEAMKAFLKVIDKRRDAPESHLEVGRLYLEHIKDPIAATYHFRKYLEVKPDVEQSPMVRQMIETAKKHFAQTLPGNHLSNDDPERVDMMELLKQARSANLKLRRRLAMAQKALKTLAVNDGTGHDPFIEDKHNDSRPVSFIPTGEKISLLNNAQFYTVEKGDTLSRISMKTYGNPQYWENIFEANRDTLASPDGLKVGQMIKLPVHP